MNVYYQIRIQGRLAAHRAAWFDDMRLTPCENGDTLLSGPVRDQAALHSLLERVRDLNLVLVSVVRLPAPLPD